MKPLNVICFHVRTRFSLPSPPFWHRVLRKAQSRSKTVYLFFIRKWITCRHTIFLIFFFFFFRFSLCRHLCAKRTFHEFEGAKNMTPLKEDGALGCHMTNASPPQHWNVLTDGTVLLKNYHPYLLLSLSLRTRKRINLQRMSLFASNIYSFRIRQNLCSRRANNVLLRCLHFVSDFNNSPENVFGQQ